MLDDQIFAPVVRVGDIAPNRAAAEAGVRRAIGVHAGQDHVIVVARLRFAGASDGRVRVIAGEVDD